MIGTLRKYSTIWILLCILILIFLSGYGLDYSALNNFSPSMVVDTVKGLLKPDWSYFFDGRWGRCILIDDFDNCNSFCRNTHRYNLRISTYVTSKS